MSNTDYKYNHMKLTLEEALEKLHNSPRSSKELNAMLFVDSRLSFFCGDCNKDTLMTDIDYYVVTHEIWEKHGVGKGMLCVDCMETRLGHKFTKEDLLPCPVNNMNPYTSKIMQDD